MEDLIRNADAAMYHSKKSGRNRYEFFTPELIAPVAERLVLANQLRRAIEHNQLVLHYQPQFDTEPTSLIGAEALVRWNHDEHGMLYPGELHFPGGGIGHHPSDRRMGAERSLPPDQRLAGRGPARWCRWPINFSAFQFRRANLVQGVAAAFARHGLKPQQLEIELTENAIMQDPKETAKTLDLLHEMGVSLSIDDFGTGYSSLNYLKRFPIDKLKIDRSFVEDLPHDLNDSAIVQAIINLAKSLRMTVDCRRRGNQGTTGFPARAWLRGLSGLLRRPADGSRTLRPPAGLTAGHRLRQLPGRAASASLTANLDSSLNTTQRTSSILPGLQRNARISAMAMAAARFAGKP